MAASVQLTSKRVCLSNGEEGQEDVDCISDLPDSVLCHILSFLPTKMSVATSILSKRWVDLWTTVTALSFSISDFFHDKARFMDSVYKVLAMYRVQTIHKLSLQCYTNLGLGVYGVHLETWINAAVRRGLQKLKLNMRLHVRLPDNVFACETLVSLEFGCVSLDVPARVRLQSLRILRLERVRYAKDDTLSRLLSSCPILEDMTLSSGKDLTATSVSSDNIVVLNISVPSLKRIIVRRDKYYLLSGMDQPYKLLFNAPLLERIELDVENSFRIGNDEDCKYFQAEDLPNLVEATIKVGTLKIDDFFRLFKGLANVEESFRLHVAILPVFRNLVYLEIKLCCKYWCSLVPLLECADNLKTLVLNPQYHTPGYCYQSPPKSVPKCVSMSLKTFKFTGFGRKECEWKLMRYILKNAKFLNQMKIVTLFTRPKRRCGHLKKLLEYPRASVTCEVGFFKTSGEEIQLP